MTPDKATIGSSLEPDGSAVFRVWAPAAQTVAVHLINDDRQAIVMKTEPFGYYRASISGVRNGARYRYILDGKKERPDPASHFQPEGVHGPSAVIDHRSFQWTDAEWQGVSLHNVILYELHVGTFSEEGTFDGIIPYLPSLKHDLGITAIEIMPVAQFPGRRNWGYDGTFLYAPQNSYGGPDALKRLVNECHAIGLAVVLDVVYNHFGPEGNYLGDFGPYFTDRYRTPWGSAVNYDGPDSDPVRDFVVHNALYWITDYHIDGLRLDAIHGIYDFSALHIVRELTAAVHERADALNRRVHVIAESDLNDVRVLASHRQGGFGVDAQWCDDFHHALWVTLTNERKGYYEDFHGLRDLVTAMQRGFIYRGQYSPHRRRRHGNESKEYSPSRFVVFSQNHDQVGNRAVGDRLSAHVELDALKAAAAAVLLGPSLPLLFMGEEYGESAPFQYFVDHSDANLIEAVRTGRRQEFSAFGWDARQLPDPYDIATFTRSRLRRERNPNHAALWSWYRALIGARKEIKSLRTAATAAQHRAWCLEDERILVLHRWSDNESDQTLVVISFNPRPATIVLTEPKGRWHSALHSDSGTFGGRQAALPETVVIPSESRIAFPPYGVTVFTRVGPS